MEKFQLQVFLNILGIGSASGLLFNNHSLFVISDNSSYLYEYIIETQKLNKIALTENPQENITKKEKPDFESITLHKNKIYIFGSGSTQNRTDYWSYNLATKSIEKSSLIEILNYFNAEFNISKEEINIEGIIYKDEEIFLFQRGNGKNGVNGIFKFHNFAKSKPQFIPFSLPNIKNVATTFTDAILIDNKIYFLAAAEDTNSTYLDGDILGSIIGIINPNTFEVEKTIVISEKHKFEGITLYNETETELEFLLCEDNDSDTLEAKIYKLTLTK